MRGPYHPHEWGNMPPFRPTTLQRNSVRLLGMDTHRRNQSVLRARRTEQHVRDGVGISDLGGIGKRNVQELQPSQSKVRTPVRTYIRNQLQKFWCPRS
jgi:hypothetical protein